MQNTHPQDQQEHLIAYTILNYLVRHPSAKDTLEGIVSWWVLNEQIDRALEKVREALDFLEAREFITVRKFRSQEKYYQLNRERLAEIRKMLADINVK